MHKKEAKKGMGVFTFLILSTVVTVLTYIFITNFTFRINIFFKDVYGVNKYLPISQYILFQTYEEEWVEENVTQKLPDNCEPFNGKMKCRKELPLLLGLNDYFLGVNTKVESKFDWSDTEKALPKTGYLLFFTDQEPWEALPTSGFGISKFNITNIICFGKSFVLEPKKDKVIFFSVLPFLTLTNKPYYFSFFIFEIKDHRWEPC